jgi:hypothetical protein
MRVSTRWHESLAQMGNAPGADMGNVTVHLSEAIEHKKAWTVPSANVIVASEAGSVAGLEIELPGGRRLFILAANVLGIIDAAEEDTQ